MEVVDKNIIYLLHMVPRLPAKMDQNFHVIIAKYTEEEVSQVIK